MEIISKISKGTKMDQVYIPKNRTGLNIGDYVVISPLQTIKPTEKPYFYNIKQLEPIKLNIVEDIFRIIETNVNKSDNVIITGSFLDKGFMFNDIDILLISEEKQNNELIIKKIQESTGIETHLLVLSNKTLLRGLSIDPMYQMMLNKCISKKRLIYNVEYITDYKILDLHLLKSKVMLDNFEELDGNEKYYLTRNMVAIYLFLKLKKFDKDEINKEIEKLFEIKDVALIKKNMLNKNDFLKKYKLVYEKTFNLIMNNIKNAAK